MDTSDTPPTIVDKLHAVPHAPQHVVERIALQACPEVGVQSEGYKFYFFSLLLIHFLMIFFNSSTAISGNTPFTASLMLFFAIGLGPLII